MSAVQVNPLELVENPKALRRAMISLSRLGRALVELIALSWDEVSALPLQRATRELNITPRMAYEYQLGDIHAELEELAETGWLIDIGGAYRCSSELGVAVIGLLSEQTVREYKRQVMKLQPSALLQALRAQEAEGRDALLMYTLKVGRQLQRDLVIADKLDDRSGVFTILWSAFESELLPRLWVAQCLRGLDQGLINRMPLALSIWVRAELALVRLYQRPEVTVNDPAPLSELARLLGSIDEDLNGPVGEERGLPWLSSELLALLRHERGLDGRQRPQSRSSIQTCLESVCEALMLSGLMSGDVGLVVSTFEALVALFEELKGERSLRQELVRRQVDPTGRLRLWCCLAHLARGDISSAQSVWSEGVRAFYRQSVGRLLGADAQLTKRVSALCLFALKEPISLPLQLPSTALQQLEVEGEGVFIDELINLLAQPAQGITPIRQSALRNMCTSPPSPLWDLVYSTTLAWSGVTDAELDQHTLELEERVRDYQVLRWAPVAEAITCLRSSAPPTHLSGLKEPSPEWLQRLARLEELAELLVEAYH